MFTGIITGIGNITKTTPLHMSEKDKPAGKQLTIQAPAAYLNNVVLGDSIALNGACMTVTTLNKEKHIFTVDISAESLSCTAALDQEGKRINMEKAMQLQDRLGGHLVTGHVDGIGKVICMESVQESWHLQILAPVEIGRFLAYKGSVTVNGVSLTVNQVKDTPEGTLISINLIPHTIENTTLGDLKTDSLVNLEIDLVARYIERMLTAEKKL
ncbi:MAG: riboflavin synthase [Saezia sp.]